MVHRKLHQGERRGQRAPLLRPARRSRAEGRELSQEERAARTGRKPRREEGRELAREPSPGAAAAR